LAPEAARRSSDAHLYDSPPLCLFFGVFPALLNGFPVPSFAPQWDVAALLNRFA
jgi:hypothetical protein